MHDQLVRAVGPHPTGIARSPDSTRPSTQIAGTSSTPSASARSLASSSARRVLASSAPLIDRGRVHLARRGGDQHVVAHGQVTPGGERLPQRGERERDAAPDPLRVRRRQQRPGLILRRERLGPAQLHQPEHLGAALDVLLVGGDLLGAAERRRRADARPGSTPAPRRARAARARRPDRTRVTRSRSRSGAAQPWMSQPSAARAASITPSDSVGWPWTIRATSA